MTSRAYDQLAIPGRVLSSTQLALLAERGEGLTPVVGEKLYEIRDATYPFIATNCASHRPIPHPRGRQAALDRAPVG
jgi:hypothetical protein